MLFSKPDAVAVWYCQELTPSSDVTIPVHVVERADDQSWLQEWQRLEKHVSRPGSGIAQALLVQPTSPAADERSPESFEIVLIVNHAFCDGISIRCALLPWVANCELAADNSSAA